MSAPKDHSCLVDFQHFVFSANVSAGDEFWPLRLWRLQLQHWGRCLGNCPSALELRGQVGGATLRCHPEVLLVLYTLCIASLSPLEPHILCSSVEL